MCLRKLNVNSNDGVCITESANNILKYNIIKYNDMDGVQLVDSSYNTISYNDISNNVNWRGIILIGSSNNTFTGNTISNNWRGIWIKQSSDCNHFSDNLVSHNTYMNNNGGIKLEGGTCNYNRFYNNTIEYNDDFGIFFSDTSNNYVTGNVIRYNQGFGFLMDDS